ncbi:MAG: hypothetical protein IJG37_05435 [Synergistaceae bacterium]|nr:hypothetical protein [Synergistaceae bacterium]
MNVQLANTYDPAKNYRVSSWFASPKFDGVRAVFIPGSGFFTRNNKPINGFERMAEILNSICTERGLSFVDGELVLQGRSFQASQSAILAANHPDKSKVEYHVFAVGGGFINTADMLNALPDRPEDNIFRVSSELIPNTFEAVEAACGKFTAQGYEGVVLRHPDTPYHEGRSNHLLKHKFFMEADLRIIEAHEGTGKYAGMLGSVTVEGEIGGKRIRSDAGTGLTVEDRKTLFTDSGLIGKVITVKYQALTDRPDREGFYSLRFPAVIGLKEDRDFPAATVSARPETHTGTGLHTGKYGFVEATFQVQFVSKPMRRASYLPTKTEMAEWKSKLYRCRSIQEGTQLIADLRLTIPKIMAFAKYLGVRLKGCKYLKAEIVRWVISASLGARLRADTVMKAVRVRKEVRNEGFFDHKAGNGFTVSTGGQPIDCGRLDITRCKFVQRQGAVCAWT